MVSKGEVIEGFVTLQNYFNCYIFKYCSKLLDCHLQNKKFLTFSSKFLFPEIFSKSLGAILVQKWTWFWTLWWKIKKIKKKTFIFHFFEKWEQRSCAEVFRVYSKTFSTFSYHFLDLHLHGSFGHLKMTHFQKQQ